MEINIFQDKLIEKAIKAGFSDCEISYQKTNSSQVKTFKKELDDLEFSQSLALAFRGLYNGKMGYSSSEKVSEEIIDFLIEEAIENAKTIDSNELEEFYEGDENYPDIIKENPAINLLSIDEKINLCSKMETSALEYDEKITTVNHASVGTAQVHRAIKNSKGLDLSEENNYLLAYNSSVASDGDDIESAAKFFLGKDIQNFSPSKVGEDSAKEALSYLGSKSLPSGFYDIIFRYDATASFLDVYKSQFYAEEAQKGLSILNGKEGEMIASPLINLIDDSLIENALGSANFDSEGVSGEKTILIENGKFQTFLYNLKSAKKAGKKSTANGFKAGIKSSVQTMTTNFFIENGNLSLDELIKIADNGLLITELNGLHALNPISGDYSLSAIGYQIEDGKVKTAVSQITVAGNFFALLKNVKAIANDLTFSPTNTASPSLLVEAINLSGK